MEFLTSRILRYYLLPTGVVVVTYFNCRTVYNDPDKYLTFHTIHKNIQLFLQTVPRMDAPFKSIRSSLFHIMTTPQPSSKTDHKRDCNHDADPCSVVVQTPHPSALELKSEPSSAKKTVARVTSPTTVSHDTCSSITRSCLTPPPPLFPRQAELLPVFNQEAERLAFLELTRGWDTFKTTLTEKLTSDEELDFGDRSRLRYLRARNGNVDKALGMLKKTLLFRRRLKKSSLRPEVIAVLNKTGMIYRRGFDKAYRPIIVIRPKNIVLKQTPDQVMRNIIFVMERAIASMRLDLGVEQLIFILDYNGYLVTQQPPLSTVIELLSEHYPERLYSIYVINAPWYVSAFKKLVDPFLPPRTAKKVIFMNTADTQTIKLLEDTILPEFREDWCGLGKIQKPYYDYKTYWRTECLYQRQLDSLSLPEPQRNKAPNQS